MTNAKFITREKLVAQFADWNQQDERRVHRLLGEDESPACERSRQGVLIHRVRWASDYTAEYFTGTRRTYRCWCGVMLYDERTDVIERPETCCHRCDDFAAVLGAGYSGLLPETACEATGGARWAHRTRPPRDAS